MAILPRIIRAATEAASQTPGIKRYKLGACLFKRDRIINAKGNSRKTHPVLLRYSDHPYLHAESNCIISHGLDNCDDLSILVVRSNSFKEFTMAKPCDACMKLIKEVGIKHVYYTDWQGNIVRL